MEIGCIARKSEAVKQQTDRDIMQQRKVISQQVNIVKESNI